MRQGWLLCFALAMPMLAQGGGASQIAALKQRGEDAVRSLAPIDAGKICANADSTIAMLNCVQDAKVKADRAYRELVLALGGLLRLEIAVPAGTRPAGRLPFDEGETAWLRYRQQTCGQVGTLAQGGTLGPVSDLDCEVTLTAAHMHELRRQYDELWQ